MRPGVGQALRRWAWSFARRVRRRLRPLRRLGGRLVSSAGLGLGFGLLASGLPGDPGGHPILTGLGLVLAVALIGAQIARRLYFAFHVGSGPVGDARPQWHADLWDLESGASLVLATYLLLQVLGGARSPLHPLVYALAAFVASQYRTRVALSLLGLMFVCEAISAGQSPGGLRAPGRLLVHAAFLLFFAVLHWLFLQGEFLRQRQDQRRRVDGELQRMREEAVDYRLLSAQIGPQPDGEVGSPLSVQNSSPGGSSGPIGRVSVSGRMSALVGAAEHALPVERTAASGEQELSRRPRTQEEVILAQGAVLVIRQSQRATLELLQRALRLHTCCLLWLDPAGEVLKVKEVCSPVAHLIAREVHADAGALGTVLKTRALLNLTAPKPGHLPYYQDARLAAAIGSVIVLPIIEGGLGANQGRLCGVLCVDRLLQDGAAAPFAPDEEALLLRGAEQLVRSLQSERVFAAVERSKYEQERLFAASERLNRALTPEQVHETSFAAAGEICDFDFAAITTHDREARRHQVVAVDARCGKELYDRLHLLQFPDNAGLVAMALKNRHQLPRDGVVRDPHTPIFDEQVLLGGKESLLVLPLICGGEAVGALVLAGARPGIFGKDQRGMLGVLANQVAVSLENARMYQAMEAMATTDGLTGLTNRRAFNDRFGEMLQRAERQDKSVTLLMSDIDHFKKINDAHGHPVGDAVLKRVAQVVQSCVRKIDMAARYGGEEFAVVLEMTDRAGARQLAERVRQEVQRLTFQSDKGPFQCTISLGMATFPMDGRDATTLTAHADQALYQAKHGGRNRAVAYEDMLEPRRAAG